MKNKTAPPFKKTEFDILYGEGISREGDLIDLAVEAEIIRKSGAWFSYGEDRLGQGRENVRIFLKENADLRDKIEKQVLVHYGVLPAETKAADAPAEKKVEEKAAAAEAGNGRSRAAKK